MHGADPILALFFAGFTGVDGDGEVDDHVLKASRKMFILLYSWYCSKCTMDYLIQFLKQLAELFHDDFLLRGEKIES